MILDAETLQPVAAVDRFLGTPGFKTELHASVVELNTGVCADAASAVEELRGLRAAASEIAASNGLAIAAAGSHPTAPFDSLPVVQEERYLAMIRDVGWAARRQGVNGLHVHVGVASGDACWERLESVLPWLPVVLALSANSPFLEGVETGMLSSRASILSELPRSGAPTVFDGYADWQAWVEAAHRARDHGRLHAHLVGRTPASALRHARGARCGSTDLDRADGAPRRRRRLARRVRAERHGSARRLSPESLGCRASRTRCGAHPSRRRPSRDRARACR